MTRKKYRRNWFSLHPLRTFGIIVFLGGLAFGALSGRVARPADIFVINNPLSYGDTNLTGILQKDAPLGEEGGYYLSTTDGHVIGLDATGIDPMVGLEVKVSGYLTPKVSDDNLPQMTVSTLTTLD